jgi:VCBS repeat-containing protein
MPVTTMPTTGEWNHIGITFDRPTVTLYVNGDKYVFDNVATGGSMDNDLTANDDVLWIGAGRSGGSLVGVNQFSGPFAGSIDELALFDRALTDADMEVIRASAPPVVTASAFSLDENSANNTVVGTVAAYDPDVGDTLSYAITAGNTGGAFAIDANGQITVANSAALDFETNPVFTLTVEATDDGSPNLSDSTTVTITLNNVNDAPVATDDSATTDENTPVAIDLLANDSDAETDPLTATIVSGPANGTLVFTPTDVVNETNLTNGSWNDRQAAWSPDGSQILFRSDRDGNHEIYVMDADGSNLIRLTNDAGTDGTPAWSPDGTQIVFGSNRDGDYEIYVMDADGSNVVQLTNNAAADVGAQWSPDGTQIVFVSNRDGNNEIYVMNADGSGQTRLTTAAGNDEDPVWSPDGTQIVFKSERDGNAEIYIMNADGSAQTRLTTDAAIDSKPNWSPDGSMILFTAERDGNKEIYVMNADGTGQARLTTDTAVDNQAVWSPDGTQILFMSERDGNSEIYIADLVFDGNVTYIPDSGFSGSDSFTYVANDGSADSNVATATITVNAVNSDPEITSDGAGATASVSIVENTTAVTTVTATDPDLDTPTFSITGGIDDGFFSIDPVSGVLTFDSAPNFESPADDNGDNVYIVEVTASDGKGGSDVQTISVTVTDGNDAPAAVGDSYTAVEGIPYTASVGIDDLLLNDSDIDGDTLTVNTTPVSGPSNGELVLNADGSFIYTPNNNFNGTDSFVYEVSDGNGGTAQATATITVQPREIRILLSTQSDVNSSKVPGIQETAA